MPLAGKNVAGSAWLSGCCDTVSIRTVWPARTCRTGLRAASIAPQMTVSGLAWRTASALGDDSLIIEWEGDTCESRYSGLSLQRAPSRYLRPFGRNLGRRRWRHIQ